MGVPRRSGFLRHSGIKESKNIAVKNDVVAYCCDVIQFLANIRLDGMQKELL